MNGPSSDHCRYNPQNKGRMWGKAHQTDSNLRLGESDGRQTTAEAVQLLTPDLGC